VDIFKFLNLHRCIELFSICIIISCNESSSDISDNDLVESDSVVVVDNDINDIPDTDKPPACLSDQNSCYLESEKRCKDAGSAQTCILDSDGCLRWSKKLLCDDSLKCKGAGECVVQNPVLTLSIDERSDNKITVSVNMDQLSGKPLPRIVDLKLKYSSTATPEKGSEIKGDILVSSDKNLTITEHSGNILKFTMLGMNSTTISNGKLFTYSFSIEKQGPVKIEFVKTEGVFSPPGANIWVTYSASICEPYCDGQVCSDGCGGECDDGLCGTN